MEDVFYWVGFTFSSLLPLLERNQWTRVHFIYMIKLVPTYTKSGKLNIIVLLPGEGTGSCEGPSIFCNLFRVL